MIDVLLTAQWVWCTILFLGRRLEGTLLIAGGALAAGYTAMVAAPWLSRVLFPPASPVFRWTLAQVAGGGIPVQAVARYIPPEAVLADGDRGQWIAAHVLLSLMFVAVTTTVFTTFVVVALLRDALWDNPPAPPSRAQRLLLPVLGGGAALYLSAISAVLLGNLSWLRNFAWLQQQAGHSVVVLWVGHFVAHVL